MKVGIDKISFYVPKYYLYLDLLAKERGVDIKYENNLGQKKMSVLPPNEDIVTMGANAALNIMKHENDIDLLIFATESSYDQSKACSIYIHKLLKLNSNCRSFEVKQACYGSTAALRLALNHIIINPKSKVLIISSDIAKYGLNTPGEPTSGCGAIAMLISQNPRVIEFDNFTGFITKDIMDFWSPNYLNEAIVDGKSSIKHYFSTLKETWEIYKKASNRNLNDHDKLCFHLPFTKIAEKAYNQLCRLENHEFNSESVDHGLIYSKEIGNTYTAALYISLISLLDNFKQDLSDKRIGFFAYGSGCVAEFFSGIVCKDYKKNLFTKVHLDMMSNRQSIDMNTYENYYNYSDLYYPKDGSQLTLDLQSSSSFILSEINEHKRTYMYNPEYEKLNIQKQAIVAES